MVFCCKCHRKIQPEDDYIYDHGKDVCVDCIEDYIEEQFDFFDIAEALGMNVLVVPDDQPVEDADEPIPGQIDVFGGVVGDA